MKGNNNNNSSGEPGGNNNSIAEDIVDISNAHTFEFSIKADKGSLVRHQLQPYQLSRKICEQVFQRCNVVCIHPTNKNTVPQPRCILKETNLLTNNYQAQEFFQIDNGFSTRIHFRISIDINVVLFKKRIMNFLQHYGCWMDSDALNDSIYVVVVTILNAHPGMENRITVEADINRKLDTIKDLETTPEHIKNLITGLNKPIAIQVRSGKPTAGPRKLQVNEVHMIIKCLKSQE